MKILRIISFLTICSLLLLASCSNKGEETSKYPSKPIQMVVAYSAGAATDTQARIIGKYAKNYLGQEVVIVNKPGGGGQVGWNYFSSVKPDGYIITAYNLPHIITQPLVGQTSFKLDTFEPIANWGYDPTVFAVRKDSPIQSLDDLIDAAKKNPGKITVGNAGKFVGQHLAILLLEQEAGIDVKDIPYQGSSEAIASVLGGHTDVISGNVSDMYRLAEDVKILAIASEERHPFIPAIPTFKELGYPSVIMSTDRGIAVKKGTPQEVIKKLEKGFLNIFNDQKFQEEMRKAGADLLILNREEMKEELKEREKIYQELIQSMNINE